MYSAVTTQVGRVRVMLVTQLTLEQLLTYTIYMYMYIQVIILSQKKCKKGHKLESYLNLGGDVLTQINLGGGVIHS